jgi:hypothetical protein
MHHVKADGILYFKDGANRNHFSITLSDDCCKKHAEAAAKAAVKALAQHNEDVWQIPCSARLMSLNTWVD